MFIDAAGDASGVLLVLYGPKVAFQVSSHAASMLGLLLRVGPYVAADGSSAWAAARGEWVWICLFLEKAVRIAVRREALCEADIELFADPKGDVIGEIQD